MRKSMFKKLISFAVIAGMALPLFTPAVRTKAAESVNMQSVYVWENHDRQLEFPAGKTKAESNTSQSGYGPEKMLDENNDTRWEAEWGGSTTPVELTLGTSSGEAEYFTGIKYVSRQDNNIGGAMSRYKMYKSEDGTTWQEIPDMEETIIQKLGTFYFIFDEPIKAKCIKIESDVRAVSEMRLLYIPTDKEDYTALKEEAQALRAEAETKRGEDIGLWRAASLAEFDEGMQIIEAEAEPESEEEIMAVNRQLLELYSNLKRAQLAETTSLNQELTRAETLVNAAAVGTTPLTYKEEDIEAFRKIVEKVKETADNGAAGTGAVQDARQLLEDGQFQFNLAQIKPKITYTGSPKTSLNYILDNLTESHFQGSGTGETVYLELDYQTELEFISLEFLTWWATQQNISKIKVECKDTEGNWNPVDSGKEYSMSWTTNTSASESKIVTFDTPAKGTAIRIYILQASSAYVIDELLVGTNVSEEDVSVVLNRDSLTMEEGESFQLAATVLPQHVFNKNVTFTSSNEEVLSVSKDGMLTAIGLPEGIDQETVTVTVKTEYAAKTTQCVVTVVPKEAEEADKQDTRTRLKNANKLAEAAKQEDYQAGAIELYQNALAELEARLDENMTVGALGKIDAGIKQASRQFEEASLIPVRETRNLIDRITGEGSSDRFIIETIPADEETGNDVYEIAWDAEAEKPILRGNDGVSLAAAYNYYLKYFAYLDFPYVGEYDLKLPDEMPVVDETVRIIFPYEYRHYFNENCEYKYTTDLYGEEEWQHRIDWMAMNGFNMFLLDMGKNAIWYNAREELGLSDEAISELQHSGNGQFYGKYEISIDAIVQEGELAKKVAAMAFKAGMEPEVRPFVGQIPFMFPAQHEDYYGSTSKEKMTVTMENSIFDGILLYAAARWMNLPEGVFISPEVASEDADKADEMKEKFIRISDIYYESLMSTLGYDEWGRTPAYVYKDLVGEQGFVVQHEAFPQKVLGEMNDQLMKLNPDAIWLQTSWRYQSWLPQYYDEGHLMFVDLCAENRPKWNSNNEFGGTPWLWSMLFNFGGNSGMEGDLKGVAADVLAAKENSSYMKGVSISPEGGDTNPALYAMMAEMTWRSEAPDMDKWVQDYIKRRYGVENYELAKDELDSVWETLCNTVYKGFVGYDGPAQTLVNAYPKLSGAIARIYGSNAKLYQTEELIPAWKYMLKAAAKMEEMTPQFQYDLVDITRQVLGDISGEVYASIKPAFDAGDKANTMKYANQMIQICKDMDEILATNKNFMLGTRLEGAKGRGVTQSDQEYFEQLERTFLTYWILDYPDEASLTDYCNRHLSGLMTDYYGMRWQVFADYLEQALEQGLNANQFASQMNAAILSEIKANVVTWSKDHTEYPVAETGDPVEVSKRIYREYQTLIQDLYGITDDSLLQEAIDEAIREIQDIADQTRAAVAEAQAAAETAQAEAEKARDEAKTAQEQAAAAQAEAERAQSAAEAAQAKAETARDNAETARAEAAQAKAEAEAAQAAAETAKEAAETAQDKAETAQAAAELAQRKAEAAQAAAETTQRAAETAQGQTEEAKTAAEAAQSAAEGYKNDAQKAAQDAAEARTAAEAAQNVAKAAQAAAETANHAAETAQASIEALLVKAQAAMDERLKKAEEEHSKALDDLAKAEAALKSAQELQKKLEVQLAKSEFKLQEMTLKSVKSKKKKQANVTWTAVDGADGYEISYAVNSKLKKAKKVVIKKGTTLKKSIKKLKSGKKYYFRVRAYKLFDGTKLYTSYSDKKLAKIK